MFADEPILARLNLGNFLQADEMQNGARIRVDPNRFLDAKNWEAIRKQWIEPFTRGFRKRQ